MYREAPVFCFVFKLKWVGFLVTEGFHEILRANEIKQYYQKAIII